MPHAVAKIIEKRKASKKYKKKITSKKLYRFVGNFTANVMFLALLVADIFKKFRI